MQETIEIALAFFAKFVTIRDVYIINGIFDSSHERMRKRCDMSQYLEEFSQILEGENKEEAVRFALDLLRTETLDVIGLYSEILTPALNHMKCNLKEKQVCVWKEHVRTAIVRTIVENCYPYVLEKRGAGANKGTAVVICPPGEYHDLGARMVADFFTICHYDTVFVGSNTPYEDFYNAADLIHPDIIAISVSNYYNLVVTKKIVAELKNKTGHKAKIVVGGYAFRDNRENHLATVGADSYAESFSDIKRIAEAGGNV